MAPDDMVPDIWPPLPIDPAIRAMAGPATDPATRQAIAAARRGIDLFMVKSFLGSPGNTFPYYQGRMDRFAEVLASDCRRLLDLVDMFGVNGASRWLASSRSALFRCGEMR
jgi:hypothetical protein